MTVGGSRKEQDELFPVVVVYVELMMMGDEPLAGGPVQSVWLAHAQQEMLSSMSTYLIEVKLLHRVLVEPSDHNGLALGCSTRIGLQFLSRTVQHELNQKFFLK